MFSFGIHKAITREIFLNLPRKDQDEVLQRLYDQGYSAKDLAKFFGISLQTIYSRIDAHRRRGRKTLVPV